MNADVNETLSNFGRKYPIRTKLSKTKLRNIPMVDFFIRDIMDDMNTIIARPNPYPKPAKAP